MNGKKVLGRGLGALIPQRAEPAPHAPTSGLAQIPLEQIQPNPYQPRRTFNEASIGLQTSSLIALGFILLVITIGLNIVARLLVWRASGALREARP